MEAKILTLIATACLLAVPSADLSACTGIALKTQRGATIAARTVEWAESVLDCGYAVVPRGHHQISLTPSGENGLPFLSQHAYVGIYTGYEKFVVEGVNEKGFSAGLFFFPGFGEYPSFCEKEKAISLCDMQVVSWALATCSSIEELKKELSYIKIVSLDPKVGTVHWRFTEKDGRMVVLELKGGKPVFYENPLGVLTNAPGFDFHLTNLRNYVNLHSGPAESQLLNKSTHLRPLGHGSAALGLPGDFTPPSRFVRAAFFSSTAPVARDCFTAVTTAFHLLNNFDIPIGMQHKNGQAPANLPSATQFTSATDLENLKFYYRTAWNQNIRCIDLKSINFEKIKYQVHPLDLERVQAVEYLCIK